MNRTLLIATFLRAAACSHIPVERPRAADATAPLAATPWEAALAEGPRMEVNPLLTGELEVERSFLLDFESDHLHDRTEKKQHVPVVAYLVRHPSAGDFLIDTGFDHTFAESGHGNFGGLAVFVSLARQQPGHDTVSLLRTLGVEPADLKMVVLSHMHLDHTAGLPDLPKTVPLVAGAGALASYGAPWFAPADLLAGADEIQALDLPDDGSAVDLLGDGSFLAPPTPSHAAGILFFLLRAKGGPMLLTCDTSHTREGFDLGVAPGGVDHRADADTSLGALRRFVEAHPEVRVKAGHEASDWDLETGIQEAL